MCVALVRRYWGPTNNEALLITIRPMINHLQLFTIHRNANFLAFTWLLWVLLYSRMHSSAKDVYFFLALEETEGVEWIFDGALLEMRGIDLAFSAGSHEAISWDWREVLAEVQLIEKHWLWLSALFNWAFPNVLELRCFSSFREGVSNTNSLPNFFLVLISTDIDNFLCWFDILYIFLLIPFAFVVLLAEIDLQHCWFLGGFLERRTTVEHGFFVLARHKHAVRVNDFLLLKVVHFLQAIDDFLQAVDSLELNCRQHVLVFLCSAIVQNEGLLILPLQELYFPRIL